MSLGFFHHYLYQSRNRLSPHSHFPQPKRYLNDCLLFDPELRRRVENFQKLLDSCLPWAESKDSKNNLGLHHPVVPESTCSDCALIIFSFIFSFFFFFYKFFYFF